MKAFGAGVEPNRDEHFRRVGGAASNALDGADVALETAQIERIDNAPDAPGDMIGIDQAVDIERQQDVLGTVDGEVARGTLVGHDLLYQSSFLYRV